MIHHAIALRDSFTQDKNPMIHHAIALRDSFTQCHGKIQTRAINAKCRRESQSNTNEYSKASRHSDRLYLLCMS